MSTEPNPPPTTRQLNSAICRFGLYAVFMHGGQPALYEIPKGSAKDPYAVCSLLCYADQTPKPWLRLETIQACLRIAADELRARRALTVEAG